MQGDIEKYLFVKLSCTHIGQLLRVQNPVARTYYIKETAKNAKFVRMLIRNFAIQYHEGLCLLHAKQAV
jgi:predicted nuclease of restriction endonuclease-like (RecB) superfamily